MKTILYRESGREYSLFRVYSWHIMMSKLALKLLGKNLDTMAMVYKGKDLVYLYIDKNFMEDIFNLVADYSRDANKVKTGIEHFYEMFDKLLPYYNQEKLPSNVKEFKKIYDLYAEFYIYSSIVYVVPNLPNAKSDLKEMALRARERTQEYNESFEPVVKNFLEKELPQLKDKTRFVMPSEVWSGEINQPDYLDKIPEREKGFVFYKGILYEGDVDKILNKLNIELDEVLGDKNVKEFKGQIAQKGKVTGKVKIVSSEKDLNKVNEGDILVATMTMPKYLIAMKKAAAFVTDEGGITCHAAIVSREMGKPCVIGTKIATQVLKDGDLVEVDADLGVVKILKK